MLKQRIMTALVLAPVALAGVFLLPPAGFSWFIALVILIGAWEWGGLAGLSGQSGRLSCVALTAAVLWLTLAGGETTIMVLALAWWVVAFWLVKSYPDSARWCQSKLVRLVIMLAVLVPAWVGLRVLKANEQGHLLIFYLFMVIWGADVGAYFAGKNFGKRKLAVNVSPGKTIEGCIGGMATVTLLAILAGLCFEMSFGHGLILLLATWITALVSVLGDLLESMLKREAGIKDSSNLLPGHGGVLDRIDSLAAAVPVFALASLVLGGIS